MKYNFIIPIGDASEDGHRICQRYHLESNKTLDMVVQAYKDSCKLTGLQMNTNTDYTGLNLDWNELSPRKICNEYMDSELSEFHRKILLEKGIEGKFLNFEEEEGEKFLSFFCQFIRLSLPDWKYRLESDNNISEFPMSIGYGLFTDG